jgi:hypothetical protein
MSDRGKTIDPLPPSFETEAQAGAFWDAHGTMDYQQHLQATDDTIEISERVFEVQVVEDVFKNTTARGCLTSSTRPQNR